MKKLFFPLIPLLLSTILISQEQNIQDQEIVDRKMYDSNVVTEIISQKVDYVAENCSEVVITFRIKKDNNCNQQAWTDIVRMSGQLIKSCNEIVSGVDKSSSILQKTDDFFLGIKDFISKENNIFGMYDINLNIPVDIANEIFTSARR